MKEKLAILRHARPMDLHVQYRTTFTWFSCRKGVRRREGSLL